MKSFVGEESSCGADTRSVRTTGQQRTFHHRRRDFLGKARLSGRVQSDEHTECVCVSVWGDHADITRSHREKPFHVSVFSLLINLHHLLRPHIPGAAGWMVEYSKYLVTILGVRKNYDFTCLSSNRQTAHILGLKHTTYRKDRLRSRPHGTEEVQEPQGRLCVKVLEGTMVL